MNINELIIYFLIYSFFGWILESVFKTILYKKPINSGFLYGPFCPIYGVGALIMFVTLTRFKNNYVFLFLFGFIVLSIWEYIVGWLLEKTFKTKYWDYSNNKFNIHGRVCLMNSMFWGILAVIFTMIIHPNIQHLVNLIDKNVLVYINVILFTCMVIDFMITIVNNYNISINFATLNDLSKKIKVEMSKESEKIQNVVEDLKHKQQEVKQKLEKQTARLRRAFPTMKSENITKFLNEKIEAIRKNSRNDK